MIQLTFHDADEEPTDVLRLEDLWITGGVIWDHLEHGMIASYARGTWRRRGCHHRSLSIAGPSCLLFGITRDPTFVSEPIGLFTIAGAVLHADGVAFSQYAEDRDMWLGVSRPVWWTSMRLISESALSALIDHSGIELLNPWEPKGLRSSSLWTPVQASRVDANTNSSSGR